MTVPQRVSLLLLAILSFSGVVHAQPMTWERMLPEAPVSCFNGNLLADIDHAADGVLYAATLIQLYTSADDGQTWSSLGSLDGPATGLAVLDSVTVLVSVFDRPGLLRLDVTNGVRDSTTQALVDDPVPESLIILRDKRTIVVSHEGPGGLQVSTDAGVTWQRIFPDPASSGGGRLREGRRGEVVAQVRDRIHVSTDGLSWTRLPRDTYNRMPFFAQQSDAILHAGFDAVQRLDPSTSTWEPVLTLDRPQLVENRAGHLFAVASTGETWQSLDAGRTWTLFAPPLPPGCGTVFSVAVSPDGHVLAGTSAGGLFRSTHTAATSVEQVPASAALQVEIYPNPTARHASVRFELTAVSEVTLTVHDALGREVARLVKSRLPAGPHHAQWTTNGIAPGTYWVRLTSGETLTTRPLSLVH